MNELSSWLPVLMPPPGGYQRLDAALSADRLRDQSWRSAPVLFASAPGILMLASMLIFQLPQSRPDPVARAMQMASLRPAVTVSVVDGAALEVPSARENVRVFLLMSP